MVNPFQFHYGSVKRKRYQLVEKSTNKFQFHYGSVKSRKEADKQSRFFSNFNSTMVRLKVEENFSDMRKDVLISIPLWFG